MKAPTISALSAVAATDCSSGINSATAPDSSSAPMAYMAPLPQPIRSKDSTADGCAISLGSALAIP
jgi:hypothetical protein